MSLEDIVSVDVSISGASLSKAGFGTILCAAHLPAAVSAIWGPELVREYTDPGDMLSDAEGFITSDRAYKMVAKAFQQSPKPKKVKVGRLTTNHTQTIEFVPANLTVGFVYVGYIQDLRWTYTVATATLESVCTGIAAAMNLLRVTGCTVTGSATKVTAVSTAGLTLDYTGMSSALHVTDVTADPGIADDLADIREADDDWYMLAVDGSSKAINKAVANYVESLNKIAALQSADYAILTNATDDVASELQALKMFRSGVWYNQDISANLAIAILASRSTAVPGSDTWANKALVGVVPSNTLTATQKAKLKTKGCNSYRTVAGTDNRTYGGNVAGGEFYDVVRFIDWFKNAAETNVYNVLVAAEKIGNTNEGYAILQGALETTLEQGVKVGGFKPNSTSTEVPDESDETAFDTVTREFTGMTFAAKLVSAVHAVRITGKVTK